MLRNIVVNDWATISLLICLALITFTKINYYRQFNDFILVIFNSNYLKVFSREKKPINYFNFNLFMNFGLSLSIFIIVCSSLFNWKMEPTFYTVLLFFISIIIFYSFKFFMSYMLGRIFNIESIIELYILHKLTFFNYAGILFFVVNALFLYSLKINFFSFYLVLSVIALLFFIGFFGSVKQNESIVRGNFFYFILYLCALEISPYIFLYKGIELLMS